MRRLRIATALAIAGATVVVSAAIAPAAQAATVGPCSVSNLRALTATWSVSCTRRTRVSIETVFDALDNAVPPSTQHSDVTMHQQVSPGTPWVDGELLPASWYIFQTCTTVTADGATVASTCFHRSSTKTTPCGVNALGGLDPEWTFGCPAAASNISVDLSYRYTLPGSTAIQSAHQVFNYALARFDIVSDGFTPPPAATIVDSTVTVTDANTSETLGTATFNT